MPSHVASHTLVNRLSVGPVTHLRISGVIDETFNPQEFARDLIGHVILDLGRVDRISSFGVRKWVEFASRLPPGASALYLINAPPLVVDQLNMVEGFAGVTQVLSVLAPYTCPRCGEDRMRLVDLIAEAPVIQESKAPAHTCPVCRSPLQFADLPSEFFDYARHQRLAQLDPSVTRYLRTLSPTPLPEKDESGANIKLVHEDVTYFRLASRLSVDLNARRLASGLEGRVVYDFGSVAAVDASAGPKLIQIFETAAQNAKVFLWRVPPSVLQSLAQTGKPVKATLCTLYLPCDCRNCGSKTYQRILASKHLAALQGNGPGEVSCTVCGGKAKVPALLELEPFLSSVPIGDMAVEVMEMLEPRALSQYLAGAAAHDPGAEQKGSDTNSGSSSLRLQILRRLGQGGMAEVFLARQVGLKGFEKYVVVKKILENFAQQPDFVEMLFAEARANARLTHQNIVQTFDVGMMNGVAYITMEFVRGPDVKRLMTMLRKANRALPIQYALRIVAETAAGLHYAHSYVDPTGRPHPMVHRDVSPHNILLSLDGAIKLSDFGIAKVQGEADNTRPGTFKGKIAYLSPEAIAGMQVDARSDVFALGVTLYELLTGKLPFRRENEAATLHAIMREPPVRPSKHNPEVPEDLANLALLALEKDPARRIPSAGHLREEVEQLMARHGLSASPTAVAKFFMDELGPQLAEFSPSASTTGVAVTDPFATARPGSSPPPNRPMPESVPIDLGPEPRPASRRTTETAQPPLRPAPPVRTESRPAQPAQRMIATAESRALPRQQSMEQSDKTEIGDPLQLAPQPPPPAYQPPRPMASPPRPIAPVKPPEPAPPTVRAPERSASRGKLIAIGLVALLLICAGGAFAVFHQSRGGAIIGLDPDETVYVQGLRVEPATYVLTANEPLIVATAVSGTMHRLGRVTPERGHLNLRSLIEVPASTESVTVHVKGKDKSDCEMVGNGKVLGHTNSEIVMEAGKEIELQLRCQGNTIWSHWALAAPGQDLDITPSNS